MKRVSDVAIVCERRHALLLLIHLTINLFNQAPSTSQGQFLEVPAQQAGSGTLHQPHAPSFSRSEGPVQPVSADGSEWNPVLGGFQSRFQRASMPRPGRKRLSEPSGKPSPPIKPPKPSTIPFMGPAGEPPISPCGLHAWDLGQGAYVALRGTCDDRTDVKT
ncbi:hypothetical protein PG991_010382 [Apiospora marii]|uniref:Uncharacterized protein n=1 Tax=Apiospora marii TaxID=335849 RepID=A0ABR1RIB9_9PEZI